MPVRIGDVELVAQTHDVLGEVPLWDAPARNAYLDRSAEAGAASTRSGAAADGKLDAAGKARLLCAV